MQLTGVVMLLLDFVAAAGVAYGWGRRAAIAYLALGLPLMFPPFIYFRVDLLSVAARDLGVRTREATAGGRRRRAHGRGRPREVLAARAAPGAARASAVARDDDDARDVGGGGARVGRMGRHRRPATGPHVPRRDRLEHRELRRWLLPDRRRWRDLQARGCGAHRARTRLGEPAARSGARRGARRAVVAAVALQADGRRHHRRRRAGHGDLPLPRLLTGALAAVPRLAAAVRRDLLGARSADDRVAGRCVRRAHDAADEDVRGLRQNGPGHVLAADRAEPGARRDDRRGLRHDRTRRTTRRSRVAISRPWRGRTARP